MDYESILTPLRAFIEPVFWLWYYFMVREVIILDENSEQAIGIDRAGNSEIIPEDELLQRAVYQIRSR